MARSSTARKGLRAARPESLTDKAYAVLEEMIVTLQLEPGEVLSETALSQELEIGRTPIREALQRLNREGLVQILPRKGILVSDINPRKQLLLLEVRRELERLIARSAAQRATDDERAQFIAIADGMEAAASENDDISFMRSSDGWEAPIVTVPGVVKQRYYRYEDPNFSITKRPVNEIQVEELKMLLDALDAFAPITIPLLVLVLVVALYKTGISSN